MKRAIWLMTFLAVSVNQVHVQEIGDPQNGLALARQVCSECHAIGRALARSPNSRSPTFSARGIEPAPACLMVSSTLSKSRVERARRSSEPEHDS
jgi:hypothetical protein